MMLPCVSPALGAEPPELDASDRPAEAAAAATRGWSGSARGGDPWVERKRHGGHAWGSGSARGVRRDGLPPRATAGGVGAGGS